jgi:hypothetical protein
MSDRVKIILSILLFVSALIFPFFGLAIGWSNWDIETGVIFMGVIFLLLFVLGGFVLFRVKDLSWLTVSLPYLFGVGYTLSPDLVPFGGDDAVTTAVGSLMAYFLALRKDSRTPNWIIIPLLFAAIYTLFGGMIPGGIDEVIVNLLAISLAGYGVKQATQEDEIILELEEDLEIEEKIEGEFEIDQ